MSGSEFEEWKTWAAVKLIEMIGEVEDENARKALEDLLYRLLPLREFCVGSYLIRVYDVSKKHGLPELLEIVGRYGAMKAEVSAERGSKK